MWGACTALTFLLARLGAQDTPATPWGQAAPSWTEHMAFWDAGWYERILTEGYPRALPHGEDGRVVQNAWAFMPLQPLLAGALAWTGLPFLAGLSFYARAALVSLAASAAAAVICDRWLAPRAGARTSLWAVALAWCSPCALVLQTPYAEALGLALVGAALALAERRRFALAVPVVLLASVARPVGLPLAAALGLWWLWETATARSWVRGAWQRGLLPGTEPLDRRRRLGLLGLMLTASAGTSIWPLAAWAVTGRPDAYTATETAWRGTHLVPGAAWFTRSQWWAGDHLGWALLLAVLVLVAAGLACLPLRRLGAPAWFWCVGYALYLLVFFDPTTSVFRLLLPLVPVAWALAGAARRPGARLALAAACVAGQVLWISWVWDLGSISIQWVP